MKNILLLLGILFVTNSHAQETKYQGLLWEITGNDLEKPSYLYGTMHVSRKIAFNLDDVFYESLDKADMVAVESIPDNWLDYLIEDGKIGYGGSITARPYAYNYGNRNFYKNAFQLNFPNKMDIVRSMYGQYQLINGLLYRSEGQIDFEEDTYLDMFIYQTGKRFGKPAYSLERYEESTALVEVATSAPRKEKKEEWLKTLIEKQGSSYLELIQDAYRNRNIGLLDSIERAINSDIYLENMLFKRNENMVDSMESIMRLGSLFSGVGAAHLAGEGGMIDLLRKRGYTLKPLFSAQTEKGKTIKSKFESNFVKKEYTTQTTKDGFLSLNCPNKLYEIFADGGSIAVSPDFDNGAYVTVTRVYTFNKLREVSEQLKGTDLEPLFFEFIPGEIISKEVLNTPYPGYDIKNVTKTGHHQRYVFYITPLEIIILKMDGKKDFVKKESDKILNSVQFHTNQTTPVKSAFGGFAINKAGYQVANNLDYKGKRFVQVYDETTEDYAFVVESILNDTKYIEEDSFELHYMTKQFCKNLDVTIDPNGKFLLDDRIPAFYTFTVLDSTTNNTLYLCAKAIGERYYLLGYLGDSENAADFFDNVSITPNTTYKSAFETQTDTSFHYSVKAPLRDNSLSYSRFYVNRMGKKNREDYDEWEEMQRYAITSNETVDITLHKLHDWFSVNNIDSLWATKKRSLLSSKLNFENQISYQKGGNYYLEGLLTRKNSQRAIKVKYILQNGTLYTLKSVVHKDTELSPFIDSFFTTFTPTDTLIGRSPLEDKSPLILQAIENQDSILIASERYLKLEDEHYETARDYFLNGNFEGEFAFLKKQLLQEICEMKYEMVLPFLEKLYLDSYENSSYQVKILRTLIRQKTKAANKKMLALLEQDMPITDNGGMFLDGLIDSTNRANMLFPALLEYATIIDYKYDIQNLLANAVTYDNLSTRKYKSLKKQFLNEGEIELKRAIGKQNQEKKTNYYSDYYGRRFNAVDDLNRYVQLLYPFRKENKVRLFLEKVEKLKDPALQINFIHLQFLHKEPTNQTIIQNLAIDKDYKYFIYKLCEKYNSTHLIPDSLCSALAFAQLYASKNSGYREVVDTIYHLKTAQKTIEGNTKTVYYFVRKNKPQKPYNAYRNTFKDKANSSIIAIAIKKPNIIEFNNFYKFTQTLSDDKTTEETMKLLDERIEISGRQRIVQNDSNVYEAFEEGFF